MTSALPVVVGVQTWVWVRTCGVPIYSAGFPLGKYLSATGPTRRLNPWVERDTPPHSHPHTPIARDVRRRQTTDLGPKGPETEVQGVGAVFAKHQAWTRGHQGGPLHPYPLMK